MMLNGLNQINWASIHHSHGTAKEFPYHLQELAKNDSNTWDKSIHYIREYSNHQNTIYEVTPYVAPFLVELIQALPDDRVGDLLGILAHYAWSLKNQHNPEWIDNLGKNVTSGYLHQEELHSWTKCVEDTQTYLEGQIEFFLPYLNHPIPSVRGQTIALLFQFSEFPHVQQALEQHRAIETNEDVKLALEYGRWLF